MPNPYSAEMRERVIARVETGASRLPSTLRSAPVRRSNGCSAGAIRKLHGHAARRKHFAIGEASEMAARLDRETAGFDTG
jgi:hypothetical protein